MAAEDARYRQSTQYRLWSFSPAQLSATREKTNALARATISERLLSRPPPRVSAPTSGSNTPNLLSQVQEANDLPEFLTPAEELRLLNYYTAELLRAGGFLGYSVAIRATSAIFFRRFYVANSIMTYPPTEMLKTCLFFGNKVNGVYLHAEQFAANFPKTTAEGILAGEFLLCQGLRFAFDVKHPYRALEAAMFELERFGGVDLTRLGTASKTARDILKFSPLMTDAYFHYTPSQIMLAALSLADEELYDRVIRETFHLAHTPTSQTAPSQRRKAAAAAEEKSRLLGPEMRDKIRAAIASCRSMLAQEPPTRMSEYWGTPAQTDAVKPSLRKLRKCRDPERSDLVALHKARREQALRNGDADDENKQVPAGSSLDNDDDAAVFGNVEERDAKRRKVKEGLDDPFGGPL